MHRTPTIYRHQAQPLLHLAVATTDTELHSSDDPNCNVAYGGLVVVLDQRVTKMIFALSLHRRELVEELRIFPHVRHLDLLREQQQSVVETFVVASFLAVRFRHLLLSREGHFLLRLADLSILLHSCRCSTNQGIDICLLLNSTNHEFIEGLRPFCCL